ncbi:MAG: hypothetical protein ACOX4R_01975 [Lentihominibacter sp.]|jgi:hypothetical protein
MLILLMALVFGIVVLLFLVRNMTGSFRQQLNCKGKEKLRAILKIILLILTLIYIALFVLVIIKTLIL